jgi:FtsP/CotA-like multicopper oxidase with cupredoxin domain
MIVVTDADEDSLADGVVLPLPGDTRQIVLSDITVCNNPGSNSSYDLTLPWVGTTTPGTTFGLPLPVQAGITPTDLCELPNAVNDDGTAALAYAAGEVPSLNAMAGRINEGLTVLTNGVNVGARAGSPSAPGVLDALAYKLPVLSEQGLRLQIVNCATTRYFRLLLTTQAGTKVDLVRVGGEGGLLDNAVLEGEDLPVPAGTFNPKYESGEILLPPSARADVVAVIPPGLAGTVLTLWTQDFQRLEGSSASGFVNIPTVPVMHLDVTGSVPSGTEYSIVGGPNGVGGTPLRAAIGQPVKDIRTPAVTGSLLDPTNFVPPKPGDPNLFVPPGTISDIRLTSGPPPGVNGISGHPLHGDSPHPHYPDTHHVESSRYAEHDILQPLGEILQLTVTNTTGAHHPFHLHGFSMQPVSLTRTGNPTFTWAYNEFRDSIDVPANYTLTFRVQLEDRTLVDGVALGGAFGRWFFHCHIFFHHHRGMISEVVVTDANGKERPHVNVGGSWAYAPSGAVLPTPRRGTFMSPEGNPVTLAATYGTADALIGPLGTVTVTGPDTWSWNYPVSDVPVDGIYYVYITATDTTFNLQDQAVFRLKVGLGDDGSDVGDPHIHTVDGKEYAFQAVGEFTLLRDREGLEIQTRQTPLESANPFTDTYSGLTSSVSVNTAIAARVGSHRISYQPSGIGGDGALQFFLDGKPARLTAEGIDLESHRVSAFDADGEMGLRVDYAHGAVLTVTPRFWFIWFLDIWVSHTHGDEGIMGSIPETAWLPTLPNGATVGPMPSSLHDRYVVLYKTFADAWRLTDETSLFVYAKGTSTETFTDRDWPAEEPPGILKPQFKIPGFPAPVNIPVAEAEQICQGVTIADLHANCVFDVGTTGDKGFAKAYLLQQDLRLHASTVQIAGDKESTRPGESLVVTAIVLPLSSAMSSGRPTPAGSVTFMVDDVAAGPPVTLDGKGRAQRTLNGLAPGEHKIRASYTSDGESYHSSSSPNLVHTVEKGPGVTGGSGFGCWWVIWILLILILIAIAAYWYFS